MAKVLVIEPDKMLRHALGVALFSEFEVQIVSQIPDSVLSGVDVILIDEAALDEGEGKSTGSILGAQRPLLWIGDRALRQAPGEPCIRLSWPVTKEALRQALADCLSAGSEEKIAPPVAAKSKKEHLPARSGKKETGAEDDRFIELVDVVEEPNPS